MKISEREKKILIGLVFILIGAGYFLFVFQPMQEKLADRKIIADEKQMQVENQQKLVENYAANLEKLNELKEEIRPYAERYYGKTDQEAYILYLHDLNTRTGLDIMKITFGEESKAVLKESDKKPEETEDGTTEGAVTAGDTSVGGPDSQSVGQKPENQKNFELSPALSPEQAAAAAAAQEAAAATGEAAPPVLMEYPQNIRLLHTEIEFEGTYTQVLALLNNIDNNPKKIVSGTLEMKRDRLVDGQDDLNPKMAGTIALDFYQVQDVSRYVPSQPSIPEGRRIPKSKFVNPFRSYPWAQSPVTDPETMNRSGMEGAFSPGGDLMGDLTAFLKRQELNGFEADTFKTEGPVTAMVVEEPVIDGKQALKLEYKFGGLNDKAYLRLDDDNIRINEKLEELSIQVYAPKRSSCEIGLVLTDSQKKEFQIVMADQVDWTGWKKLSYDLEGIYDFPIQVRAVYLKPSKDKFPIEGDVVIDSLAVRFLSYQ